MRRKQEILFNFWLVEKIQKHVKLTFLTREGERERERERKVEVREITCQNNDEYEMRLQTGVILMQADGPGKKSNFEKLKILI